MMHRDIFPKADKHCKWWGWSEPLCPLVNWKCRPYVPIKGKNSQQRVHTHTHTVVCMHWHAKTFLLDRFSLRLPPQTLWITGLWLTDIML